MSTTKQPSATAETDKATSAKQPAAAATPIRTPWGRVAPTLTDLNARDPLEPDAPLTPAEAAARAKREAAAKETRPLSPRELYEMLMTPAAQLSRTSPLRKSDGTAGRISPSNPPSDKAEVSADPKTIPAQADLVLSAMEAGAAGVASPSIVNRRNLPRRPYRVKAALRLFSDAPTNGPWVLFTRDVHGRGVGFISQQRIPLGHAGTVELPKPASADAATTRIACTVLRCREAAPGWFEGALYFNREQPEFDKA